jgi:hypothetical protein
VADICSLAPPAENTAEKQRVRQQMLARNWRTGYGAKALVQDDQMLARRGHLVLLRRTLAKQFYFLSGGCANYRTMYVFCRHRDIVIGGSVQDGNESELANSDDDWVFRKIIENARKVFDGRPRQCI